MVNARTHQCQDDANHIAERAWCTNEFSTSSFTAVCSSTMTCPLQIRCTAALSMAFIAAMALCQRAALDVSVWISFKFGVRGTRSSTTAYSLRCTSVTSNYVCLSKSMQVDARRFCGPHTTPFVDVWCTCSVLCFAHSLLCLALVAPFLPFG